MRTCDGGYSSRSHRVGKEIPAWSRHRYGQQQWVRQTNHDNINDAMAELKGQGMQVLVTTYLIPLSIFVILITPSLRLFCLVKKYGASDEAKALPSRHCYSYDGHGAVVERIGSRS